MRATMRSGRFLLVLLLCAHSFACSDIAVTADIQPSDSAAVDDSASDATAHTDTTSDVSAKPDTASASDVSPADTADNDLAQDTVVAQDLSQDLSTDTSASDADVATDTADVAADVAADTTSGDATGLPDGPSSQRFSAHVLSSTTAPNGFWEYLPPGYGDGSTRPLLVSWHGIGENGDGETTLNKVTNVEPPKLIKNDAWPSERPFIVLSPQHAGGGCPSPDEIYAFIAWAIADYDVDPTRVYLTGLSCGAIGSWNYLRKYTNQQIAAIVPIAGDGKSAWNMAGCDLGLVPIWAFHGDADPTVNVSGTNVPIDNLLAQCPSPPRKEVKKTIYPGVAHNSWTRTYNLSEGHDIYAWMLGFTQP